MNKLILKYIKEDRNSTIYKKYAIISLETVKEIDGLFGVDSKEKLHLITNVDTIILYHTNRNDVKHLNILYNEMMVIIRKGLYSYFESFDGVNNITYNESFKFNKWKLHPSKCWYHTSIDYYINNINNKIDFFYRLVGRKYYIKKTKKFLNAHYG